jgi:soluble lytic murein transglycosylase-like protein
VRAWAVVLICFVGASACLARETVYLTSGFTLSIDSHSVDNGTYVFHIGDGTLEYPAAQVREIVSLPPDPPTASTKKAALASSEPKTILRAAALTEGVDELFVRAVAKVESGMRQEAISRKGALGLMQLMPGTASELGVDPKRADQNASGGARYLRSLLERYNYNPVLALAAYNAGPGAVTKYHGIPPYYETRTYVVRVLKEYENQLRLAGIKPETLKAQATKTPISTN